MRRGFLPMARAAMTPSLDDVDRPSSAQLIPTPLDLEGELSNPRTYGIDEPVQVRETHASRVYLAGPYAYKVKKPVRLPFLDYGTLERRRAACRQELRVNRELGGEIYERVLAIVPGPGGLRLAPEDAPGAVEYALRDAPLRRAPDARRGLAEGGLSDEQLEAVARRLQLFHRDAQRCRGGGADSVQRAWRLNLDELLPLGGSGVDVAAASRFATAFVSAHREEIDRHVSAPGWCATDTATCAASTCCSANR